MVAAQTTIMEMNKELVSSSLFERRVESMLNYSKKQNIEILSLLSVDIFCLQRFREWNRKKFEIGSHKTSLNNVTYAYTVIFFSFALFTFIPVQRTIYNCKANSTMCDTSSQRKWSIVFRLNVLLWFFFLRFFKFVSLPRWW